MADTKTQDAPIKMLRSIAGGGRAPNVELDRLKISGNLGSNDAVLRSCVRRRGLPLGRMLSTMTSESASRLNLADVFRKRRATLVSLSGRPKSG
jgi:hypothetical protein